MKRERDLRFLPSVISGAFLTVIIVLVGVLAFALFNKYITLGNTAVKIFAQGLKILSLFIACFIKVKEKNGFIKGGCIGVLAGVIEYFLFYLLIGSMSLGVNFLIEIIFCLILGAISGVIAVNLRK